MMGEVGSCVGGWPRARGPLPFSFVGAVIALIDCTAQFFPYPNEFLDVISHRGSDNQGSTCTVYGILADHRSKQMPRCLYEEAGHSHLKLTQRPLPPLDEIHAYIHTTTPPSPPDEY